METMKEMLKDPDMMKMRENASVIYGIYLLYNLKKAGGYWVVGSNIVFIIYASIFGPIAEVGFSTVLPIIALYFVIYIILVICVPWYYSDKFE